VTIAKATPAFSNLSAVTIEAGAATTTLGGVVSLGALVPTGMVAITFNGATLSATVGPDGRFGATFQTASLAPSPTPYGVSFGYGGDGNFNGIVGGMGSVRVIDTTAPAILAVSATPDSLGPPDHKMIDVTIAYQAADLGADGHTIVTAAPSCGLTVTSNEPVNGTGDGNTAIDWIVIDPHHIRLRAERDGTGTDRLYTIAIGCTDGAGNRGSNAATVRVSK
jgi:hypothetical protein